MNGNGISDYVNKYYRIKNEIVSSPEGETEFQIWLQKEFYIQDMANVKDDGWKLEND